MTDPKRPPAPNSDRDGEEASRPLDTEYGHEGAEDIGAEHDGPTKAPDAEGGAYIIP